MRLRGAPGGGGGGGWRGAAAATGLQRRGRAPVPGKKRRVGAKGALAAGPRRRWQALT